MSAVLLPGRPTPIGAVVTTRVRRICLSLPMVSERLSHGDATWFVAEKKSFVSMSDHHDDDRVAPTSTTPTAPVHRSGSE